MEPTFSAGDYVLVLDQDPTTLRTGQVPLLSFEEGVTRAHRIVQVSEERGTVRVLTGGDANAAPDPWSDLDVETPVPVVVASIPAAPAAFEALRFVHTNALPAAAVTWYLKMSGVAVGVTFYVTCTAPTSTAVVNS